MFLGHYGLALGAKRYAPAVSLGWLVAAAQLLDEIWPIFLLLGIEKVRIAPGLMAANSLDFVSYPYSHSLLTAIGWAVIAGVSYYAVKHAKGGYFSVERVRSHAVIVGLLVVSHWLLDLPMHRPDLPLMPGLPTKVGFGLWDSIPITLAVELLLFGAGLVLYLRSTRARDRAGSVGLWAMVAFLLLAFVAGTFAPPPAGERALALGGLMLWLFVPWSAWIDRHRETRETPTGRRY
jgi:hypothetical protein